MRVGFAGTPQFAATQLGALLDAQHDVVVVLTQPDRPTGRGRKLVPSPVKTLAAARGLPVRDPPTLKGVSLVDLELDVLIVAAYGLLLPESVLSSPRLGCVNVHASLLPRWRGAAPVERAIMAGDRTTGVCLMQMERGLDTGPVFACETLTILEEETGSELEARLAAAGARLLVQTLPRLEALVPTPQPDDGVTYAAKLTPEDSVLRWEDGAPACARRIRALTDRQPVTVYARIPGTPAPVRVRLLGATPGQEVSTDAPPGTILGVSRDGLELACGGGSVIVREVQLNRGKGRPMAAAAAANGYSEIFATGARLSATPNGSAPPGSR